MQAIAISQEQLAGLMSLLKESLAFFDKQCYSKVAFINDWCLYRHIREFDIPKLLSGKRFHANIGAILDVLEPYIPFTISEENFELFIQSTPKFIHKAKLDFVVTLRGHSSPDKWDQALQICESIRAVRENLRV